MELLYQILAIAGVAFLSYIIYQYIKNNPEQFKKEILNKSFNSMGILALALIAFIGFVVILLNS